MSLRVDLSGLGYGPVVASYKCGNEPWDPFKTTEILDQVTD